METLALPRHPQLNRFPKSRSLTFHQECESAARCIFESGDSVVRMRPFCRQAFTLIELLAVIAVIGVLTAILIPAMGMVRERSMAAKTASNFRQVYAAHALYSSDNKGRILSAESSEAQKKLKWPKKPSALEALDELGYLDERKGGGCYVAELYDFHKGEGYSLDETKGAFSNIRQNGYLGFSDNSLGVRVQAALTDPAKTFFLTEGAIQANGDWYWQRIQRFTGDRALPEAYGKGQRYILYADGHLGRELQANLPETAWDGAFSNADIFWFGKNN